MKKQFCVIMVYLLVSVSFAQAQTLFTYGSKQVNKQEFLDAFRKNNPAGTVSEKEYRNYLDMYIRYKLKVEAAYEMKLDTLPSQKKDLQDFRQQLMKNYLADEETMKMLVNEAIEHGKKDLRISHIYILYNGKDSLTASKKAHAAMDELKKGTAIEKVAETYSDDPAVRENKADIGWISVFMLPYALEKLAYQTPLNSNSEIYKSKRAYHIFRRTAERPAKGTIQVAQILLEIPVAAGRRQVDSVEALADSIYNALQKGAEFGKLATAFSADNSSFNSQGVMQSFSPGTYDPSFEDKAFALEKNNDISKPFRSTQGFHILKRIGVFKLPADTANESALTGIRSKVLNDPRHQLAIDAVVSKAKKVTGFSRSSFSDEQLDTYTSSFFQGSQSGVQQPKPETVIATINNRSITLKDYSEYLSANADMIGNTQPALSNRQIAENFLQSRIFEVYQVNLEKFNPAFASQVKEFRDGNMIFEAMQIRIWDKAINDEAGLKRYYEQNQERYKWKESVRAVIFTGLDSANSRTFYNSLKASPGQWRQLTDANMGMMQADSGRYETDQLPAFKGQQPEKGKITDPVYSTEDLNTTFVYILDKLPANEQRNFEEARGFVLNDYQAMLEEEWINALKKKYPVKINESVFRSLNR